ncbi:MAG: aldo/keto reductase [Chloroflexi bacterium]|nr:aldo/keto reductase [Chloroflexota bacterium]
MKYRPFGKLGYTVSALGFGCMRLPTTGDGQIDEEEATRMVHYAIEHGVNYLDTGYPYHGGQSEPFLGQALQGGYRQRVRLATKLPVRNVEQPSDCERLLDEQLERLQTDYLDVYLLHGLRRPRWESRVGPMGILEFLERALADGRIRAAGFSFHDSFELFKEIIDAYDHWNMCQIQYNFMNEHYQAGSGGLRYAASKGLAVVVMEPLLGGKLANPPEHTRTLWETSQSGRSPVEWALQWLWDQPEVSVVLSGMSTMAQMQENVASADRSGVAILQGDELALIEQVRDAYSALAAAPCTGCGYCMPCPNGVDIPRSFGTLNQGVMYDMEEARRRYTRFMPDQDERILASSCVQCRTCEDKCPQGIPISEWMPYVHAVLAEGQPFDPKECPQG